MGCGSTHPPRVRRRAPVNHHDEPVNKTATGAGLVLLTLASAQFLMTLDSSVMNVSIAQVAEDVGTTVTGVQTAITLYTLVMATTMITGGKIGTMIGRRRAFSIGCVIYACGSFTTAIAPNLTVLIIGWSFLEGLGAALIMPAIVALVATNFPASGRPRAYGLVAAAGAIAVAAGPLIGGAVTTFWTWRLVFAGEVVIVIVILFLARRINDVPPKKQPALDYVGILLSSAGLGLAVYGVLRSGEWGWVLPREGGPDIAGLSPTVWLVLGGLVLVRMFFWWEGRRIAHGQEPLVSISMLGDRQLAGGLTMFFFQFLLQAGLFFTIPLYLSVALGLSALETGIRLLPLSITLLLAATGVPKLWPNASPQRVVSWGLAALLAGIVSLIAALEVGAGQEIVTVPAAVRRARRRRARLPARCGDRVVDARREERRGRRPAEHRDQPGCVAGHGPRGLGPHRRPDVELHLGRPGRPGRSRRGRGVGRGPAERRRPVRIGRPARRRPGGRGRLRRDRRGGRRRERVSPDRRPAAQPQRARGDRRPGAVLHPDAAETTGRQHRLGRIEPPTAAARSGARAIWGE